MLPVTGEQKFENRHSLLALSHHILYVMLGCYLAARLAPDDPIVHALAIGAIGIIGATASSIAIVARDLAPAWYGPTLAVLAVPLSWGEGSFSRSRSGRGRA